MAAKKGKKRKIKKVSKKQCASGRAYKSSGRCVPKKGKRRGGKAKRVTVKRAKRGCYAKTRDIAIEKMDLLNKRTTEREAARAAAAKAEADAAVRHEEATEFTIHEYDHMDGFGRVRRRRRRWR